MAQQSPTDGDVKLGGGIRKWNKEVDDVIIGKRQAFKAWKAGKCTQASYNTAKRISIVGCTMYATKQTRWFMVALGKCQ